MSAKRGPTAPTVVQTMGMKERPRAKQPGRWCLIFSPARSTMMWEGSAVQAGRYDGRKGQETVTSRAVVGGSRSRAVRRRSTLVRR